jgi:hypothetical protein
LALLYVAPALVFSHGRMYGRALGLLSTIPFIDSSDSSKKRRLCDIQQGLWIRHEEFKSGLNTIDHEKDDFFMECGSDIWN